MKHILDDQTSCLEPLTDRESSGEYPAGSVGCAESTGSLKEGQRNRWFILFTNSMIDFGFVIGAFAPCKRQLLSTKSNIKAASPLTHLKTSSPPQPRTPITRPSGAPV